ncbi:MAG TPA: RIO1 family regulatory kinase/ATPase [Roseiflexaceae bacterium]|nr:RIO1 family regulatory kinase/ATPase [Roseiflexaceae bacterium]
MNKKPIIKQSYENNPDVQRWLQEQALDDAGARPSFEPTLLAGLRDRDWVISSLRHFYEQELIDDVLYVAKSGKEATVYCCTANPATGLEWLAAKIYRPRMFRSLSNDALYRNGREQRDKDGRVLRNKRQRGSLKQTERGRAAQVSSWIEYEYATQRLLYEAGADVPRPIGQIGNAVLMEFVGDGDEPAARLSEVDLAPQEAQPLFDQLLRNVELALAHERIHGDLSAYNILYWQGAVTVIDFAQAVDPRHDDALYTLLERDIDRLYRFFARYGVRADPGALAANLWTRYLCGEL